MPSAVASGAVAGAGSVFLAPLALIQRDLQKELKRPTLIHAPIEEKELEDQYLAQEFRLLLREYWPHPLLEFNGYFSTFWSALWAVLPARCAPGEIEQLVLQDGGTISLHWGLPPTRGGRERVVLVLPGFNMDSCTSFVQETMRHLRQGGFQAVAMNYRATGGLPMTSPRLGGPDTWRDIPEVVDHICLTHPDCDLFGLGFSMGGGILLKHLGEEGHKTRMKAAVAIAAPVDLLQVGHCLESSKWELALNFAMVTGAKIFSAVTILRSRFLRKVDLRGFFGALTFRHLLSASICKLHGYTDYDDFCTRNNPRTTLSRIAVPTLMVNAEDDPVIALRSLPIEDMRRNPRIYAALTRRGGHLGWGSGGFGAACWTDAMAVDFLLACSLRASRPSRL